MSSAINPYEPTEIGRRSVAWLKLVPEDSGALRAALFETTSGGEPLAFRFTRSAASDGRAVSEIAADLLRAAPSAPTLALALSDDAPEYAPSADDDIGGGGVSSSIRPIAPADSPAALPNDVRALLSGLTRRDDPSEPFRRAAACLDVAFADPDVRAVMEMSGFRVVATLPPPAYSPDAAASPRLVAERAASVPARSPSAPSADSGGRPRRSDLHQRMWAILASPLPAVETAPRQSTNGAGRANDRQRLPPDLRGFEPDDAFEKLMPFQRDGVGALLDMKRLLLADDMGLGKTVQAISALRVLRRRREVETCLVVAPAGLLDQWRRELSRWAPELSAIIVRGTGREREWQWAARVDVAIVSYDSLRSDLAAGDRSRAARRTWGVVVADEAQRVKNRESAASRALKTLRRDRAWALTGTPIENREDELASILEFVDGDGASSQRRYHPGPELTNRHRELQLRRKKSEVLDDLPPKMVSKLPIELTAAQRAAYDRAENEGIVHLKSLGAEVTVQHVLELISRLKQICNFDPRTGESSKMDDIAERLEELVGRGHRALIFSQYVNPHSGVEAIESRLRKFNPLTFTGALSPEEREDVVRRFKTRDEHKALIMSLRAGGLGLNLQEASYVFHVDRWWNPAVERQAEDRAHRMGQTAKVNVIKYSCADTVERRIDDILERKQTLFDDMIDDVSLDISQTLNRDELFGLFGLR